MERHPHIHHIEPYTMRPNVKKIWLKNLFNVVGALMLILLIVLFIQWQIGFDTLSIPLEMMGVRPNASAILYNLFFATIAISTFLLVINYILSANCRYEIYPDKLVTYKSSYLVFLKSEQLPFHKVANVFYTKKGIINNVFNCGSIVIDLVGQRGDRMTLDFIDNVEEHFNNVYNVVRRYMLIQRAQLTEDYRLASIVENY